MCLRCSEPTWCLLSGRFESGGCTAAGGRVSRLRRANTTITEVTKRSGGEVFRYSRGDEIRVYHLHVVAGGTELWRVTLRSGEPDSAVKEETFTSADVAAQYFGEIERALRAGGWREISRFTL